MVKTYSTMLDLAHDLPAFTLPDFDDNLISSSNFERQPILVIFLCNHCPYVKHVMNKLSGLVKDYQKKGIAVVGINSNDYLLYPDDDPDVMVDFAALYDFSFPYLVDETQEVAKAYKAACTPDFYLFDANHKLVYRGQMDDSRPNMSIPVTGKDLTAAIENMLAGKPPLEIQKPSVGCNIKWKPGMEPDYFTNRKHEKLLNVVDYSL